MRARVVVLAGPSGSGKSRLAGRLHDTHGWPIVRLDDFYRDHDDPAAPREESLGIVDWDHVDSWKADDAVDALGTLVDTGSVDLPVYDISTSRAIGAQTLTAHAQDLILAEGIFAAEIIGRLRERGLPHSAWCIHHRPVVTFARRLARDLKERRKPPMILVRRGLGLMREEPDVVARQTALGATSARPADVERRLGTPDRPVR